MYRTSSVDAVATITELRYETAELVEHAREIEQGILIQKNNEPYAVLISPERYRQLMEKRTEAYAET